MTTENFTTYTEVDPNTKITVTASKVSWALINRDEDSYVYLDKGVDFFSGDFEHLLTIRTTGGASSGTGCLDGWALANVIDDWQGLKAASQSGLIVVLGMSLAGAPYFQLEESDGGTPYNSATTYTAVLNTSYYLKVVRDESVGTYGTFYLYIYSDAARTVLLATLSITLHTSKKDYRYIYALQSWDTNESTITHSGYTEDLDLKLTTPTVTTQAVTAISGTTATGNGNVTSIGDTSVTQHGHCWNTTGTPTTADSKTTNGVASATGAFTSAITALTKGTLYHVRAYVTNTAGTSYGSQVSFVAITGEGAGVYAVVETYWYYIDAYGTHRYVEGKVAR